MSCKHRTGKVNHSGLNLLFSWRHIDIPKSETQNRSKRCDFSCNHIQFHAHSYGKNLIYKFFFYSMYVYVNDNFTFDPGKSYFYSKQAWRLLGIGRFVHDVLSSFHFPRVFPWYQLYIDRRKPRSRVSIRVIPEWHGFHTSYCHPNWIP